MIPSSYFTQSPRTDNFSQVSTSKTNNAITPNNNNNNKDNNKNFRSVIQSPLSSQPSYQEQQHHQLMSKTTAIQQQKQYHQTQSPLTPPPVSLSPINYNVFQSMVEEKRHERISNEINKINKDIDIIKKQLFNLTNQVNKIQERDEELLHGLTSIMKKIDTIQSDQNQQQQLFNQSPSSIQSNLVSNEHVQVSPQKQTKIQTQIESQSVSSQSQALVDRMTSVMSIHDNTEDDHNNNNNDNDDNDYDDNDDDNNNNNNNNEKVKEPISVQEFLYHKHPNAYKYVAEDNNSGNDPDLLFQESQPPVKRMNLGTFNN